VSGTQNENSMIFKQGGPRKRGHVLRFVTLKLLTKSAQNLAQINVILYLIMHHNLFESTSENKQAPSSEWWQP